MVVFQRLRVWLVAVGLLNLVLPVYAAEPTKCLPADTEMLVRIEVKQIVASPVFGKQHQKEVDQLLKMDAVQAILKDTGFDPLKDVDQIYMVMGRESQQADVKGNGNGAVMTNVGPSPLFIVQGRFDRTKIEAKAEQLAKDMPKLVQKHKVGDAVLWEIAGSGFVAVADKDTVLACTSRKLLETALEQARGTKKVELKHKSMQALLAKLDPKLAVQWLMCEEAVTSVSSKAVFQNGQGVVEVKYTTLKDQGIENVTGGITIGADVRLNTTLVASKAETAKDAAKGIQDMVTLMTEAANGAAQQDKSFAPVVEALKSAKVAANDKTVTVNGQTTSDAAGGMIKMFVLLVGKPANKTFDQVK
ncbi:MAG: hypothetical protein K2R98_18035 [Gemmataceae bacterium]|nr:hypothetical protein [Gemmataceae bacterium]